MPRGTWVKRNGLAITVERRGTSSGIALRHLSRPRLHVWSAKGPHWRRDWPQRRRFWGSDSQDNQDWRCLRVPTQARILITPKEPRVLITVGGQSIPLLMSMSEAFSISFILEYNFITQKLWAIRPHPWPQIEFSSGGQESQGLLWFSSNLSKGSLLFEMITSHQSNWYGLI